MALYGESFTLWYTVVAIAAFFLAARVFGELPLARDPAASFLLSRRTIVTSSLVVFVVLLYLASATKLSAIDSRQVMLTWRVLTPFVRHGAAELARRLLQRFAAS